MTELDYCLCTSFVGVNCCSCWCSVQEECLAFVMTAVTSAAKMVGQLRRWLTGEDVTGDSRHSVENVSGHCDTCTCDLATNKLQYRGRSYSDCCATSCRSRCQDAAVRERSCSVNSRQTMPQGSKRLSSQAYHASSGRHQGVREVLDEDRELCRCWSGSVEPVCCCERCFVYVDERPPLLPPPYSELMLLECYADLAKRLTNTEPSITANTADIRDQVTIGAEASVNCTSSSTETYQSATGQYSVTVSTVFSASFSHLLSTIYLCDCNKLWLRS